jgi:hydrogenase maturation protease
MKTLVLGLGNLLLADEGVGVHAAQALMKTGCPGDTTVLDIGTSILEALPDLETADRVIIIDAVKADGVPGSVYRMPYDEFAKPEVIASMHGFDLSRVFALTRRSTPPEVIVIGVEPEVIGWSLELSPEVRKALRFVLDVVQKEIGMGEAVRETCSV